MRIVIRYKNGDVWGPSNLRLGERLELDELTIPWLSKAGIAEIEIGEPKEREA